MLYRKDLSFDLDGLAVAELDNVFLREGQGQDAVFKLCLDIFLGNALSDVEASGHGTGEAFLVYQTAFLVFFLFLHALGSRDGEVASLQLQADLIFLEAGQINNK